MNPDERLYRRGSYQNRNLTQTQLDAAWVLYQSGWSVPAIAEQVWARTGYANPVSCASSLRRLLRRQGRRLRSRGQAKRLHHQAAGCARCGRDLRLRTRGCMTCTRRHWGWKQAGRPHLPPPNTHGG